MSPFLSLLGWSFLPNLVTGWVQTIFYGITVRAGDPKPQPGTPRYAEHRRRIHILVVALYLAYTIYEADFELRTAGNFYTDLGLPLSATDRDVKSRFRRLAALHHPDKQQAQHHQQQTPADADDANAFFVHLKLAADTLLDPARRFAYERFGPDVTTWQHCATVRDYLSRGAQHLLPYYAVAAAALYALGLLGYLDWGRHWRWLVLACLLAFELHAVTRPRPPFLLAALVNPLLALLARRPPYLPFQAIQLARKLSVTLYIAFSQIGPLLAADTSSGRVAVAQRRGDADELLVRQGLDRLEANARALDADTGRLLDMEMAPLAGDPAAVASMRQKVKEWLVQNTIRADPMVRDALGQSLRRRRVDAPAGARGTR